jgi:hypothetical protein
METNIIIAGVLVLVLLIVAGVFIFRKKDNYIPVNEFRQPYFPHRMMYGDMKRSRFNPYIRGPVLFPRKRVCRGMWDLLTSKYFAIHFNLNENESLFVLMAIATFECKFCILMFL